ncbi:MAG: type I-E CRISPR-associated protein Cas5/CasD [Acidimicrobiia bacterium]
MSTRQCLVLRLAGPLQSWGSHSQFNRRETDGEPTKSGVVGLLAAASGRRRSDPISDLVTLELGVRIDQGGSLLRDYHTVSDYRRVALLSAKVNKKGQQVHTSPSKFTAVTQRYYLQDAVFVAAVGGDPELLTGLADAVRHPEFPLALGRRSCVPTMPILLEPPSERRDRLWNGSPEDVLGDVPWQASPTHRNHLIRSGRLSSVVRLASTIEVPELRTGGSIPEGGVDTRSDVPVTFEHARRAFTTRLVRHCWHDLPTGHESEEAAGIHDPFALLGW